ncbi:MerR family transcriptional regulator [Brevibacillus sp. GCM10020057]|uniref:MerR family transcriptional regulator n=1 Tax=Brevibacillus sp. GCM10020057 TaxID=3317327 RepID=UPI003625C4A1
MLYTVKEVSAMSKVTIKTLHHYHKIGLLLPQQTSEAGYRLYGTRELERLRTIMETLEKSINATEVGERMENGDLFKGFDSEAEWEQALSKQHEYLQKTYQVELKTKGIDVVEMNEQAREAAAFMKEMADALRAGIKHTDEKIRGMIEAHLAFLNHSGLTITPADFAGQTRFFLQDDFHLAMLEGQQTGLAYYLAAAAEAFAAN